MPPKAKPKAGTVWEIVPNVLFVTDANGASMATADLDRACRHTLAAIVNVAGSAFDNRHAAPFDSADGRRVALRYANCPVLDSVDATLPLGEVFELVDSLPAFAGRPNPKPGERSALLVHCRGAHSRSLAVAAALLVRCFQLPLPEALLTIKRARGLHNINRGFMEQLAALDARRLSNCPP